MPPCKRCGKSVTTNSDAHFRCTGPGACNADFHISCARLFSLMVSTSPCCRMSYRNYLQDSPSSISRPFNLDKNRPIQNISHHTDDSDSNLTVSNIHTSSPNIIPYQALVSANQPAPAVTMSNNLVDFVTTIPNQLPSTTTTTTATSTFAVSTSAVSYSAHIPRPAISTGPILPNNFNNLENLIHSAPMNIDQTILQQHQLLVESFNPISTEPQINKIPDLISFSEILTSTPPSTITSEANATWQNMNSEDRLTNIMHGISQLMTSMSTLNTAVNQAFDRNIRLENEVKLNREYIQKINTNLNIVDGTASQVLDAMNVAENDINNHRRILATSDTQFLGCETILSGIPNHCPMSIREIADRFLIAINAGHIISNILEVRQLKPKVTEDAPVNHTYFKIIIKFSSYQTRKFVIDCKRRRGKIVYKDIIQSSSETPPDAGKILYLNDLLPSELYNRFNYIKNYFRNYKEITIKCTEGQIFLRKNRDPQILITDNFDLNSVIDQ